MTLDTQTITKSKIEYIVIACCTYKRPASLEKMLNSLAQLTYPENIKTEILIVDNDTDKSAKPVVDKYNNLLDVTIHYAVEEKLGLANVRNKALTEALNLNATHLAFIDDDEVVDADWLLNHIEFYEEYPYIHISSAPTFSRFEKKYPNYITKNNVFKTFSTKPHGQLRAHCATGNVFFPLDIIKKHEIYFDTEHNFIGGEDGAFFLAITKLGYNIGWNTKAANYELVGDDRANISWIIKRKYFNGYSGALLSFEKKKGFAKRFFYIVEKIITIFIDLILLLFSILLGRTCFLNCLGWVAINAGKLFAAIYLNPIVYYQKRDKKNN